MFFQMKFVRKEGLAVPQLMILRYIFYTHPENLSSIAEYMGVTKPTVSGIMATLEKEGYVKRVVNPEDRRIVNIVPTEKSTDLFSRLEQLTEFVVDGFVQCISAEDLKKLNDSMVLLTEKLKESWKLEEPDSRRLKDYD